jgi:hypothetical protein
MESHCEDPEEFLTYITAKSDEDAKEQFKKLRKKPEYGYSHLRMERIDQEEKTTSITMP